LILPAGKEQFTVNVYINGCRILESHNNGYEEFYHLQSSACYLLHAAFLHGLFFNPEDGGDKFFRNIEFQWTTWCYEGE
jgi:hypothetical protein